MKKLDFPHKFNTFDELLNTFAHNNAELPALTYEKNGAPVSISRGDLAAAVKERAQELRSYGMTCLGVLCDGSLSCVVTIFASVTAGMQTVLLDENAADALLQEQIRQTDIDILWSSDEDLVEEN